MLDRYEKYLPAAVYLAAFALVVTYSFQIGRSTGHQEERVQINYQANKSMRRDKEGQGLGIGPNNPPTEPNAKTGSDNAPNGDVLGIPRGEGLLIVVTMLLAAATFRLVTSGKEAAERQLRAYVSVDPDGINPFVGPTNAVIAHIMITNVGRILAKNVSVNLTLEHEKTGKKSIFPVLDVEKSELALHPRTEIIFGSPKQWEIPNYEMDETPMRLPKIEGFLWVWGKVTYTDEFQTVR